jgi:hypothetical protein
VRLTARFFDVAKFSCYSQMSSVPHVGLKSRNGGPYVPILPVAACFLAVPYVQQRTNIRTTFSFVVQTL